MWHMMGGEHFLKMSAPQLLGLGIESVLMILNKRITQWMNQWISDKDVCRTAPATPGLLSIYVGFLECLKYIYILSNKGC